MENLPRGRRSRRSSSNLNLSNISPLTTHFSLTSLDTVFTEGSASNTTSNISASYSYIHHASAPSTPSILSRAPSRKRRPPVSGPMTPTEGSSTSSYMHASRIDKKSAITKSKSASHLLQQDRQHLQSSYFESRPRVRRNESTEWVHRAGIALTSEARESKGQSWLANRASSTSLLEQESSDDEVARRYARRASVPKNFGESGRGGSAGSSKSTLRQSRSRGKLARDGIRQLTADSAGHSGVHPLAPEFIDEAFARNTFDEEEEDEETEDYMEDMDDSSSYEIDEDDEDLHWSKRPRTGLGAWVDSMVGWSLFSVDEEFDSDGEERKASVVKIKEPPRLAVPASPTSEVTAIHEDALAARPSLEDSPSTAWQDAAWVLSVASKVLF